MNSNTTLLTPVFCIISFLLVATPATADTFKRFVITGGDEGLVRQEVESEGGRFHRALRYSRGLVVELPEASSVRIERRLGSTARVEEDFEAFANGKPAPQPPSQPPQTVPWGIGAVQATAAYATTKGAGVTVCVIDTGIQDDHPDLAGSVIGGENFVFSRGRIDSNRWRDDNGHGTHVSGTIAARDNAIGVIGVAPESKLFAVKALDSRGSGYVSDIADGIRSCVAHGAKVINMSLGSSGGTTQLSDAVAFAIESGVVLVAAAGNEGGPVSYPAKYLGVIGVSAVDSALRFAGFSNFGPEIDFAAPGVSVLSTVKGSGYATYSGTSMASPHVAGVAALMLSASSRGMIADDIGLSTEQQGLGLINALKTVLNK